MGTRQSTPQQEEERRQRELMETLGVLVPPSFGSGDAATPLPPSALAMRRPSPSLLYSLEQNSACYRILHEHLTPGLWVSASTPSQANVLAAFYVSGDSNQGLLSASQSFDNKGMANIRAYTSDASLVHGEYLPVSGMNLVGNVNAKGSGWCGANLVLNPSKWFKPTSATDSQEYYRNNPFQDEQQQQQSDGSYTNMIQELQFGASVKLQQASTSTRPSSSQVQADSVLGHASMQVAGCTVAMEAKVPLETLEPHVSYYSSANLNTDEGPPLIVTMQHSPTSTSMNLSQVLTFDRYVVNLLETRCPRIRNTLGWAVEMKRLPNKEAELSAGIAWQVNRGLACKVVASNQTGIKGALLLKRWKQPRVLCSIQVGTMAPGKDVHVGLGLELETGPHSQDFYNETEEQRVDDNVPVTKATLPEIGVTVDNN